MCKVDGDTTHVCTGPREHTSIVLDGDVNATCWYLTHVHTPVKPRMLRDHIEWRFSFKWNQLSHQHDTCNYSHQNLYERQHFSIQYILMLQRDSVDISRLIYQHAEGEQTTCTTWNRGKYLSSARCYHAMVIGVQKGVLFHLNLSHCHKRRSTVFGENESIISLIKLTILTMLPVPGLSGTVSVDQVKNW